MKWKAIVAMFVLAATLVIPAAQSVMNEQEISLFIVDEEKGGSTGKVFSPTEEHLPAYHILNFLPILSDDPIAISQIPVERALEFQTPPPDVC